MFQLVRRSQCSYCSFSRNPSPSGRVVVRLIVAHAMSDVGMSHVRCRMYLSNDPKTKCDISSSGHVTNTFDIVHGTSQHLTFSDQQQANAPFHAPVKRQGKGNFTSALSEDQWCRLFPYSASFRKRRICMKQVLALGIM